MTAARLLAASLRRRLGDSLLYCLSLGIDAFVATTLFSAALSPSAALLAGNVKLRNFFAACGILALLFSWVSAVSSAGHFAGRRRKEVATWILLGMPRRRAALLAAAEPLAVGVLAFAGGVAAAGVLNRFFSVLLGAFLGTGEGPAMPVTGRVLLILAAAAAVPLGTAAFGTARSAFRLSVREQFDAPRLGDAPSRRGLLAAVLGLFFMIAGYALASLPRSGWAVRLMLPVLVLEILGPFLLARGALPLLLGRRFRARLAAKAPALAAAAQAAFRMRRNADYLALASVLVAVAATAGGTLFVLAGNETIQADRIAPNDAEFLVPAGTEGETALASLDSRLKDAAARAGLGLAFRRVEALELTLRFHPSGRTFRAPCLPASRWNELMRESGRDGAALPGPGELLLPGYYYAAMDARTGQSADLDGEAGPLLRLRVHREGYALSTVYGLGAFALPDETWERLAAEPGRRRLVYGVWNLAGEGRGADLGLGDEAAAGALVLRSEVLASYRRQAGALLFLGIFMTGAFLCAVMISGAAKLLEDAREDRPRYALMRSLGLDRDGAAAVARIQVGWMFALPLCVGTAHTAFALGMLRTVTGFRVGAGAALVAAAILAAFALAFAPTAAAYRDLAFPPEEVPRGSRGPGALVPPGHR